MPSLTIENYLKGIYKVCIRQDGTPAATGQLAAHLGVSPGTVTSMLKTLSETGLVSYTPYEGVHLTNAGLALALRVLRRHRLIELFLAKTLDMNWDEVHEEAEHMEHSVSDHLIDRIDSYLGCPEADPHGDPIPRADGSVPDPTSRRMADCVEGERFLLVRVLDQSPKFLRYLSQVGLPLGTQGDVIANQTDAGIITVRVNRGSTTLGREVAEKIMVSTTEC